DEETVLDIEPLFVDAGTRNFNLKPLSPAIDAGDPNTNGPGMDDIQAGSNDLAGNNRIQSNRVDMGAYESSFAAIEPDVNGRLYVKKDDAGNGSSWAEALGELADALQAAKQLNSNNPGTVSEIWVAAGTYFPLYDAAGND